MIIEHPRFIGFVQYLIFGLLGLLFEIIGYAKGTPFPVSAFSALFSLSIVILILYSPLIGNKVDFAPGAALAQFARGAYYAGLGMSGLTLLLFGLAAFISHQSTTGFGFLFLGVGTVTLPQATAGAGYGKMLATSEDGVNKFLERLRNRRAFEVGAAGYLALWLGAYEAIRRDPRPAFALVASVAFSIIGWIILENSGGYPYSVLGILVLIAYIVIARFEARIWVPKEKRNQVSDLLAASMPHV